MRVNLNDEKYMTAGQVAKKMGITIRTIQYYDKENILKPSSKSENGHRLYTDKDLVKLHQILSLKALGFSLDDIKSHLTSLDTPSEVAEVLDNQSREIKNKIEILSESLREIELLKAEVLQMKSVNFKKYADIIINLQMKNDFYWLIKHFDDKTMDHIRKRFDKDSGLRFLNNFNNLNNEILKLKKANIPADNPEAQILAEKFWNMIMDFTNGDMSLLTNLMEIGNFKGTPNEWQKKQKEINNYIEGALEIYFTKLGINPFEEEKNE